MEVILLFIALGWVFSLFQSPEKRQEYKDFADASVEELNHLDVLR